MKSKIKKKQIIVELFGFITRAMIKKDISDPLEVRVSLCEFEKYINEKLGAQINSIQHIYQQIRAYERKHHVRLFKKTPSPSKEDVVLTLLRASDYQDKLFLHIGLKMAVANGAYDLMNHLYENTDRPLKIYLSAGSESYYFTQMLYRDTERQLHLYTHNLGIIENYINHHQHLKNVKFHTRFGTLSLEEFALFEKPEDNYVRTDFDAIIASTTFIDDQGLYIESENEIKYKKEVFRSMKGTQILLLTLLEYSQPADVSKYKYAQVQDFDYIVIPSEKLITKYRKRIQKFPFQTMIKYYNYEVLKNTEKHPG